MPSFRAALVAVSVSAQPRSAEERTHRCKLRGCFLLISLGAGAPIDAQFYVDAQEARPEPRP